MPDIDSLIQDFHDYFVNLYRQAASPQAGDASPAAPQAFLATEPIGKSLTDAMFVLETGEYSSVVAQEQFSYLANTLPVLDGSTIVTDSISSVDGLYELILGSATPLPTPDPGPFEIFKREAQEAFDRAKQPPLLHDGREHRPAVATPPDWSKPGTNSGWTAKSFSQQSTSQTTTTTGTSPPVLPPPVWKWQVAPVDLRPALESPAAAQRVMLQRRATLIAAEDRAELPSRPAGGVRPMMLSSAMLSRPLATATLRTSSVAAMTTTLAVRPVAAPQVAMPIIRPQILALQAQDLAAASAKQEVTASELLLSFEYCLVHAARPWMSTPVLNMKTWFMPATRAGEMASGSGTAKTPFEVIPMAALVVRNLTITAKWSEQELVSLRGFTNLGPFSLIGRTIDASAGSLVCPGMQVIGWICEPMMKLPPAADPALPA